MKRPEQPDHPITGYCVHWRSLLTGLTGCGAMGLPRATALRVCDTLNREFVGQFEHWVEAVAAPEEAEAVELGAETPQTSQGRSMVAY